MKHTFARKVVASQEEAGQEELGSTIPTTRLNRLADQQLYSQEADGHELVGQDKGFSARVSNSPFETLHIETSLPTEWHQIEEVLMVQEAEGTNGGGGQAADGQPETNFDKSQKRWISDGVCR